MWCDFGLLGGVLKKETFKAPVIGCWRSVGVYMGIRGMWIWKTGYFDCMWLRVLEGLRGEFLFELQSALGIDCRQNDRAMR